MSLAIGIVGLPNVGKSTLFMLLTEVEVNIANYPFTTIDPNVAVVAVKDERLERIAKISRAEKVTPATIEFFDIAGLVKNAHQGEGLGNQFLAQIRNVDAIIQVVRCFENIEVSHIEGKIDPLKDIEIVNTELIFKDLETLEKRINKIEGEVRTGRKEAVKEVEFLNKIKTFLDEGKLLISAIDEKILNEFPLKELNLLTAKKQIYLFNGPLENAPSLAIEKMEKIKADYLIMDLDNVPDLSILIQKAYQVLGLITFFTIVGENETRAWSVEKGTKIVEAAEMIHSDFKEKFIKAEVVNWQKLLAAGSWYFAREKGWLKIEGKDYKVEDGDVITIKHG